MGTPRRVARVTSSPTSKHLARGRRARCWAHAGAGEVGHERGLVYSRVLTSRSTRDLAVTPTLTLNVATPGHATGLHRPARHHATRPPRSTHRHRNARTKRLASVGAPIRVDPHEAFRYTYRSSTLTLHRTVKFSRRNPATALWHSASAALAAPSCANALLRAARRRPHASATEFRVAHDRQFDRHRCH